METIDFSLLKRYVKANLFIGNTKLDVMNNVLHIFATPVFSDRLTEQDKMLKSEQFIADIYNDKKVTVFIGIYLDQDNEQYIVIQ